MEIGTTWDNRMPERNGKGFTMAEMCIVLVVAGLMIGGILTGIQLTKQSLLRCETDQFFSLVVACGMYYEKHSRLPGDWDGNGRFDNNSRVWNDLESMGLANRTKRSPHGGTYSFQYSRFQGRYGNYVRIKVPGIVGAYVDRALDDGAYRTGDVRSQYAYTRAGNMYVVHFIPLD